MSVQMRSRVGRRVPGWGDPSLGGLQTLPGSAFHQREPVLAAGSTCYRVLGEPDKPQESVLDPKPARRVCDGEGAAASSAPGTDQRQEQRLFLGETCICVLSPLKAASSIGWHPPNSIFI